MTCSICLRATILYKQQFLLGKKMFLLVFNKFCIKKKTMYSIHSKNTPSPQAPASCNAAPGSRCSAVPRPAADRSPGNAGNAACLASWAIPGCHKEKKKGHMSVFGVRVGSSCVVFPQTVWPHWGVLTISVKARCGIRGVRHFLVNFTQNGFCEMSMCISTAQARTKRCPRRWSSAIFPLNFHTKWIWWHVHLHFHCAGSRKMVFPEVSSAIFPFHAKWTWWHVHVHFHCASSYRNLAKKELVKRSCQGTSYGDLVHSSCQETSYRDLANRAPIEILYTDLARRPLI